MKYVVGDIHGEITKLKNLVSNITKLDKNPEFIFIGDYLDKGENVFATLSYLVLLNRKYKCNFLYGNHEYVWINLHEDLDNNISYLSKYGGIATITSFGSNSIVETQLKLTKLYHEFFAMLKPYWIDSSFIAVHSGINPNNYSTTPENIELKELLFNRYEFIKKDELYLGKYRVIFGHTGFYSPFYDGVKIGIDTAACFMEEQPLTSFCIDNGVFINSNGQLVEIEHIENKNCPNILRVKPWRYAE
jgi:serine/threonine protein phosphatase 1